MGKKFSEEIYLTLKENNHIESKIIQQLFDEKKQMFLQRFNLKHKTCFFKHAQNLKIFCYFEK